MLEERVCTAPLHNVMESEGAPKIVGGVGNGFTVISMEAESTHPPGDCTEATYVVVTRGATINVSLMAPVDHVTGSEPSAIKVICVPLQEMESKLMMLTKAESVLMVKVSEVDIHPNVSVTVTEYMPAAWTVIEESVSPVLHITAFCVMMESVTESPLHNNVGLAMMPAMVGVVGNGLMVMDCT